MRQFPSKIRTVAARLRASYRHWRYRRKLREGEPIGFHLPHGLTVELYPNGQIPELLFTSNFEWADINAVAAYLKPGMRVLDIGANVGLYSIIAGKIVGPGGKVWAFEPSSETYELLIANLQLNHITCVEVLKLALSDVVTDSLVVKRDPGYRDGDRYLSTRQNPNIQVAAQADDLGDTEPVEVTTLDHYFECKGTPRVDFMKVDVEGGEYGVFRGARQLLTLNRRIMLMFECTPQGCYVAGHKQEDVFYFLSELGFKLACWHQESGAWSLDTQVVEKAGNIWACRDTNCLPRV